MRRKGRRLRESLPFELSGIFVILFIRFFAGQPVHQCKCIEQHRKDDGAGDGGFQKPFCGGMVNEGEHQGKGVHGE